MSAPSRSSNKNFILWLIYLIIIALSFGAWLLTKRLVNIENERRAKYQTQIVSMLLEQHFSRLNETLLDMKFHFENYPTVTIQNLIKFGEETKLADRLIGIQGVGYMKAYRTEKDASDIIKEQNGVGVKDFKIWPSTSQALRSTILAIFPNNERNKLAIGFDMLSEPIRQNAILESIGKNESIVSDPVELVQEMNESKTERQSGLLIYLPEYYVYDYKKPGPLTTSNFKGSYYGIIRVKDFLEALYNKPNLDNETIQYRIYINNPNNKESEHLIYTRFSDKPNYENNSSVYETRFLLFGKEWIVRGYALPNSLGFVEKYAPDVVLIFSFALMLLVTFFVLQNQRRVKKEIEFASKAEELALKAEAASQAKSAFLANMSHEIRTPLGAIMGFSELISSESVSSEKKKELIGQIKKNGDILTKLLSDILDSARIEAGRLDVEMEPVYIPNLIKEVFDSSSFNAQEKKIELNFDGDEKSFDYLVLTDEVRLKQILTNLVNNAIRFTEKGKVSVRYGREINRAEQNVIFFEVEDSGIGISKQNQHQLFMSFGQVDSSSTRKYGGTGLGLALSKKLAQLIGGDVFLLRSDLGQGTTFRVEIPYKPTENKFIGKKETHPQKNIDLTGCRILLVEDSVDNQEIFSMFLNQANAQVKIAKDGKEALVEGVKPDFDIILMDIQIPHYDGKFVTRELRKNGVTIPIIALTAHAQKEEIKACFNAGCDDHVAKPVTKESLLFSVKNNVSL